MNILRKRQSYQSLSVKILELLGLMAEKDNIFCIFAFKKAVLTICW